MVLVSNQDIVCYYMILYFDDFRNHSESGKSIVTTLVAILLSLVSIGIIIIIILRIKRKKSSPISTGKIPNV